jgi:hypothetical protein
VGSLLTGQGANTPYNPLAAQLQGMGRGEDSMLVHMTPHEVNSLRGLAHRFGGELTTNPHTGLPEAGWLGKLLPTILGIAGAAVGIPTWAIAAAGAAGGTAATGSLSKGLMIGLQAYGGAGLGSAMGLSGSVANIGGAAAPAAALPSAAAPAAAATDTAATGTLGAEAGAAGSGSTLSAAINPTSAMAASPTLPGITASNAINPYAADAGSSAVGGLPTSASPLSAGFSPTTAMSQIGTGVDPAVAQQMANVQAQGAAQAGKGFLGKYSQAIRGGLPGGTPSMISKIMPYATGLSTLSAINDAFTPTASTPASTDQMNYAGPYTQAPRKSIFESTYAGSNAPTGGAAITGGAGSSTFPSSYMQPAPGVAPAISRGPLDTREVQYFDTVNPQPNVLTAAQTAAAQKAATASGTKDPWTDPIWNTFRAGGTVLDMAEGGHVIPAFDVATLGNGSSAAGQRKLMAMGGVPINGDGDGVSDSIPASIDGKRDARVADGEVYFPPDAVQKLGGNAKLYALMRGAEKARMRTKSGEPVKMAKGLA